LEKLSRGLEKILGVGLNFKNEITNKFTSDYQSLVLCICAASIKHKETSMNDESIDAQNQANEIMN